MKCCNDCRTFAPDNTLFCPTCGSSYGTKLCPRHHPNPPSARFCRMCGSPELSRTHRLLKQWSSGPIVAALLSLMLTLLGMVLALVFFIDVSPLIKILALIFVIAVLVLPRKRRHP